MRQRLWRALRLAVLMGLAGAGPAMAQQVAPSTYMPALRVFVGEMVRAHLLALRCADETRRPGGALYDWDETRAALVASLWASGYPENFVREIDTRMSIQAKQLPCDDAGMVEYRKADVEDGTLKWLDHGLTETGIVMVQPPVDGSWDKILAAFAGRRGEQQRELACLAVLNPRALPNTVGRWQQALVSVDADLAARGFPRPDVTAQIEAADANRLWQPVAEDAKAALGEDCETNSDWLTRRNQLQSPAADLRSDVEAILAPSKAQ